MIFLVSLHLISCPYLYRALMERAQQLEHQLLAMSLKIKRLEEALASARAASTPQSLECYRLHQQLCSYSVNGTDRDVHCRNGETPLHLSPCLEIGQVYLEQHNITVHFPCRNSCAL